MRINFEIDGRTFWIEDIKIRDYYEIKTDLMWNTQDHRYAIVSKLSGCPIDTLRELTMASWNEIWIALEVMLDQGLSKEVKVIHQFTFEGVEYGLVDFDNMTIGEFSDLDLIVSGDNVDNKVHEILAILYRPIVGRKWKKNLIEKYDVEGFKWRSQVFLDLPVSYAKASASFFLSIAQASLKATGIFSKMNLTETEKKVKELSKILLKDGMVPSSSSLEKILSISKELQNLESEKHSTSSPIATTKQRSWKRTIKRWFNNITNRDDNTSLL